MVSQAGSTYKTLAAWMLAQNGQLASGSRVLCNWPSLLTLQSAPGCYRGGRRNTEVAPRLLYAPDVEFSVLVVEQDGRDLVARPDVFPVEQTTQSRKFKARVTLATADNADAFLVLDGAASKTLRDLLREGPDAGDLSEQSRRLLHRAADVLEADEIAERPAVDRLIEMAISRGLVSTSDPDKAGVATVVRRWRVRQRGALLPPPGTTEFDLWSRRMLDSLEREVRGSGQLVAAVEKMGRALNREPLRVQVTAAGRYELWLTVPEAERDERIAPWPWAERWPLKSAHDTWIVDASREGGHAVLPHVAGGAVEVIHEWPAAIVWGALTEAGGLSQRQREQLIAIVEHSAASWDGDTGTLWGSPEEIVAAVTLRGGRRPGGMSVRIIGTIYLPETNDLQAILVTLPDPMSFAFHHGNERLRLALSGWARGAKVELATSMPGSEVSLLAGAGALKLFATAPYCQTAGNARSTLAEHRDMAVGQSLRMQSTSDVVRYVPAKFDPFLRKHIPGWKV